MTLGRHCATLTGGAAPCRAPFCRAGPAHLHHSFAGGRTVHAPVIGSYGLGLSMKGGRTVHAPVNQTGLTLLNYRIWIRDVLWSGLMGVLDT